MIHVFVSYSRADSETVDRIVARLTNDDFEVWLDRKDIKGGNLWREEIVEAVDHAYAFVLMLSPNSAVSENVRKEVDVAEGSNIDLIPVVLSPVKVPARLRYQLAGIQWIEYYRDPEAKYVELVQVLHTYRKKSGSDQTPDRRQAELVISKIDISKFGLQEQEKLLNFIAEITSTPRGEISLTTVTAGSIHAFVDMPAKTAYQLKTAALNRDARLINFGIVALRLSGDRKFISLKTGRIEPLKSGKSNSYWFLGGLVLFIVLLLSSMLVPNVGSQIGFSATATPTPTNIFTPTPTGTFTATPSDIPTASPSLTATPTETFAPTPTATWTPTNPPPPPSSPRPIIPRANDVYSSFANCQNVTFAWRPTSQETVTYTLHLQTASGADVASPSGIRGTSTILELCSGNYQWQVNATRISDSQTGPWSNWIPFEVRRIPIIKIPILTPIPIPK